MGCVTSWLQFLLSDRPKLQGQNVANHDKGDKCIHLLPAFNICTADAVCSLQLPFHGNLLSCWRSLKVNEKLYWTFWWWREGGRWNILEGFSLFPSPDELREISQPLKDKQSERLQARNRCLGTMKRTGMKAWVGCESHLLPSFPPSHTQAAIKPPLVFWLTGS